MLLSIAYSLSCPACRRLDSAGMASAYLTCRQSYVERGAALAEALALRQETAYDASLLMDRVMATGTEVDDQLGPLFSAATLLVGACTTKQAAAR